MSKMSDFFKTKSGLAIKVAVTSTMAVNAANAASDITTFDEHTGYENPSIQSLVDMKEQKLALDEVVRGMNVRVAHCDLVVNKLGHALNGMNVVLTSKGFSPVEKLAAMGKIADGVLNDPVNFHDFATSYESEFHMAEMSDEPASAQALSIGDILDQGYHVEIEPEELRSSAAEVLDRTTRLIGALQEDLDVCVEAVTSMMRGYNNIRSHADVGIGDPENFLATNLGLVSQAYGEYSEYVEHSYMEDYVEMRERMTHEEEQTDQVEMSSGMKI